MDLNTYVFGNMLKKLGFDFYSGVPCSFLKSLINYAIQECNFVMSTNEGDAIAICAGAYLSGKKTVVFMQNSGLTNAASPLTSLNYPFKLPTLGFVSLRGAAGIGDEPQHELLGSITEQMLELMKVEWEYLSADIDEAGKQLERANQYILNNKTFFFIVKKGTFGAFDCPPEKFKAQSCSQIKIVENGVSELPKRIDILRVLHSLKNDNTALIATTGKTGRELYEIEDAPCNLYMVGSMGAVSSIGLGIALNVDKKVIAIDGDGALLMRMGCLATNAYYAPENFLHLLIDNNSHDSTGGQFTVSNNVNFVEIASNAGYKNSLFAHSLSELEDYISKWNSSPQTTFIHIKSTKGSSKTLGRPTIKPHEVKQRLISFLKS